MLKIKNIIFILTYLLLSGMLPAGNSHAATGMNVMFVVDNDTSEDVISLADLRNNDRELIDSVSDTLLQLGVKNINLQLSPTSRFNDSVTTDAEILHSDLLVTVGTNATRLVIEKNLSVPVLAVFVPRLSFDELTRLAARNNTPANSLSVIFLDQPLSRRLNLVRLVLPRARRVGVVFGPSTERYEQEFRNIAASGNFQLNTSLATDEDHLIRTIDEVLVKSDVLLGIVDPLVFNRTSARSVLITTYRRRTPLLGISPSYVRAGALAAVYSTPTQIGRQLAETVQQFAQYGKHSIPGSQYPRYFSVSVNYQVADSLGIHIDDDKKLTHRLENFREVYP